MPDTAEAARRPAIHPAPPRGKKELSECYGVEGKEPALAGLPQSTASTQDPPLCQGHVPRRIRRRELLAEERPALSLASLFRKPLDSGCRDAGPACSIDLHGAVPLRRDVQARCSRVERRPLAHHRSGGLRPPKTKQKRAKIVSPNSKRRKWHGITVAPRTGR